MSSMTREQARDILMGHINDIAGGSSRAEFEDAVNVLIAAPPREASEAGQGVDLEQFRRPVTVWRALAEIGVFADYMPHHFRKPADEYSARVKEADRLLAIINAATPKDQPAQGVDGE